MPKTTEKTICTSSKPLLTIYRLMRFPTETDTCGNSGHTFKTYGTLSHEADLTVCRWCDTPIEWYWNNNGKELNYEIGGCECGPP